MKNHTPKAQNTNHGSLETPLEASPNLTNQETLWNFESRVGQALLTGSNEVDTTEEIIRYFLKSAANWDAFIDTGNFIYKNCFVTLKK